MSMRRGRCMTSLQGLVEPWGLDFAFSATVHFFARSLAGGQKAHGRSLDQFDGHALPGGLVSELAPERLHDGGDLGGWDRARWRMQ